MSKYQPIQDVDYKDAIRKAWKLEIDTKKWFPKEIAEWIVHHATTLGVPETYISIPFLVAIAYLSSHATVTAGDLHTEPVLLYALVCRRSGTNKSASLNIIL